ncbi:hypothetical protein QUC31_001154 [Theobroma cacao]
MVVTILFLLLSSIYHKMAVTILFLLLSSIYQKMAVTILFLLLSSILFTASAQPRNTIIRPGTSNAGDNVTLNLDSNDGMFRLYSHSFNQSGNWSIEWSSSNNRCNPKGLCGVNSYCTLMDREPCDLGRGSLWYSPRAIKDDCREECFRDCNCEVALYGSVRQVCQKLKLPLRYGRRRLGGSMTTFVKIGTGVRTIVGGKGKKREVRMDIFITGIGSLMLAFFVLAFSGILIYRHRIQESRRISDQRESRFVEQVTLKSFTYEKLKHATNNFTDNIGRGSCGAGFKVAICNGSRIVAIKRLEKVLTKKKKRD